MTFPNQPATHSVKLRCIFIFVFAMMLCAVAALHAGTPASDFILNVPLATFNAETVSQAVAGRSLVDIEILWDGTEERYSAVYLPLTGTPHTLIQGTVTEWGGYLAAVQALNGRFLDFEVGYFDGDKRYSGIFLEDGDNYSAAIYTTNDDATWQTRLRTQLDLGRQLIDFEAYEDAAGDLKYAGIWTDDPNQPKTHLYYGLLRGELEDLLDPPLGRVLDIEQYPGPQTDGALRFAVLLAQAPGDRNQVRFAISASSVGVLHPPYADADTHMVDIDFFISGIPLYNVVWGSGPKTLLTVPSMPGEVDAETRSSTLQTLIDSFESSGGQAGEIGLYARNLRSNQSVSYRSDNLSYLASTAKIAMHIRYLQQVEAGHLNENTMTPYTNDPNQRDDWYVDERDGAAGPFNTFPGFGNTDFGSSFAISRFDRAMMQVSDNGATSMLVDDPTLGLAFDSVNLNEWLASVSGVGPEFGLVTSIQDVDRFAIWQGQQNPSSGFLNEPSYLGVPAWAISPTFRTGIDTFGDLNAIFTLGIPGYSVSNAIARYQTMGLNQASPRALGNLMAQLWQGDLLNPANTALALLRMSRNPVGGFDLTSLNDHPSFPASVQVQTKGGTRFGANAEAGVFRLGPDAISVALLTEANSRDHNNCIAGANNDYPCDFQPAISYELLIALAADLQVGNSTVSFGPSPTEAGQAFLASCLVLNSAGGDAGDFPVTFYASTDGTISATDLVIGTVSVPGLAGGAALSVEFSGSFPASIDPGTYSVGCIADPHPPGDDWGAVGELDETESNNNSDAASTQLVVNPSASLLFSDGFESGNTSVWSSTSN